MVQIVRYITWGARRIQMRLQRLPIKRVIFVIVILAIFFTDALQMFSQNTKATNKRVAKQQKNVKTVKPKIVQKMDKVNTENAPNVQKVPKVDPVKTENVEKNEKVKKAAKQKPPHIILMVADDLGFNDVSYHGAEIRTPNIDALARAGVTLENYYVQPVCTPTRSQLLSGRYQIHTGLHAVIWPPQPLGLPLDSPTIADKLREAGYSTHMIGKWHLGFHQKEYTPTYRGFDTFFGYLTGHEDYFNHSTGFHKFKGYDLRENEKPADVAKYHGKYSTHMYTDKTIDLLRTHDKSKPLFVYLPFQAPHTPIQVPDSYVKPYAKSIVSEKRRIYAGNVACLDEAVGNVTRALKQLGYWKNSVVIFTTDNGSNGKNGGSNKPLRGHKSTYWEGGIRAVGCIYNSKLPGGTVSKDLIHVSDWYPTLVNLAGGNLNGTKPLDGFDQWDTLTKKAKNKRTEFLINIDPTVGKRGKPMFNNTFDTSIQAGIRMGDWKLITGYPVKGPRSPNWFNTKREGAEGVWLFNIKNDPNESKDLSDRYPDLLRVMLNRLRYHDRTAVPPLKAPIDPRADPNLHGGFWGPWL